MGAAEGDGDKKNGLLSVRRVYPMKRQREGQIEHGISTEVVPISESQG